MVTSKLTGQNGMQVKIFIWLNQPDHIKSHHFKWSDRTIFEDDAKKPGTSVNEATESNRVE